MPPPAPGLPTFGSSAQLVRLDVERHATWVCTSVSKVSDRSTGRCGSTLLPGGRTITFKW